MKFTTGTIVSIYNDPTGLESCLLGLSRQSVMPKQIYVADDGSGEETRSVIHRFSDHLPIIHIWHKDEGFRLSEIRNKAAARSTEDYLVFLDGDSVPHRHFIADHQRYAGPGTVVLGQRCSILGYHGKVLSMAPTPLFLFRLFLKGRILNDNKRFGEGFIMKFKGLLKGIRLPLAILRRCSPKETRGGNLGVWRKDLLNINGFNEAFRGWGHEDIDFVMRLQKTGVVPRQLIFAGVCYHIDHPINMENEANELLLSNESPAWCEIGIDRHLTE